MARFASLIRPRTAIVAAAAVAAVLGVAGIATLGNHAPAGAPPVVTEALHNDTSAELRTIPNSGTAGRMEGVVCRPVGAGADPDRTPEPDQAAAPDRTPAADHTPLPALPADMCAEGFAPVYENEDNSVEAQRESHYPRPNVDPKAKDPVVQTSNTKAPTKAMPAAATGWDGLGDGFVGPQGTMTVKSMPPDTSLDVSASQIVETVNSQFAVFSKTGTVLYGPVATNTLFSGFGGLCQTTNDGDATVQWDRLSNRWVISQFAVTGANGTSTPFLQCVAVSATSDATGVYYRYAFPYSFFNDYPKLAVWPDAYYTTFNGYNAGGTTFVGGTTCAYERAQMLAGLPARQVCFTEPSYGGVLVAGIEGSTAPATGAAAYAIAMETSTKMAVWRFHVDWSNTTNSAWTKQTSATVASYAMACNGTGGTCIVQPNATSQLDTLGDRLMYRFVYRNVGGTEMLALSHSVNSATNTSNVRWYLFSPSGSTLTTADQGTYAPDSNARWMPSVALDQQFNLALGYSASSASLAPSVRYAGRLASDPPGLLSQGEANLLTGGGSQVSTYTRWGDYSGIAVDPADDCTFWVANEYEPSDGQFQWHTRIGSFKYPSCGSVAPTASLTPPATPTNAATLTYTAGFSAAVTGLAIGDFSVTGSATGCTVGNLLGSGSSYTVDVAGCSAGAVILTLAANSVADGLSNAGPAANVVASTVTIDRTAPAVSSFSSVVASPTNSTTIAYSLTFSKGVTGIAAGDFSNAGSATGCTFAPSGSGASYTLTVTTCSTTGTLQPQLAAGGVTDNAGNTGPASAASATTTLTLDRVAPTVSSITPAASATNAASTTFTVTFSESVTGVAAGNFSLITTGAVSGASITNVTGSAASWTVTVVTGTGDGTIRVDLSGTAPAIADLAGNPLGATFSAGSVVTVDKTPPTVTAFSSAVTSPNNSTSIAYTLTFSEGVTGLVSGDFTNAGTATGCTFTPTGSGASYTVTATTCSATGTLQPQLAAGSVSDAVGNPGPASAASATTTLTLNRVAPTVISIVPASTLTNGTATNFTVTLSEPVTGAAIGNFSLTTTGGVSGASVSGLAAVGATLTVSVSTGTGDGTIRLDLSSTSPAVTDAGGNALTATFASGSAVTVDKTPPTAAVVPNATLTNGATIDYSVSFSESVTGLQIGAFARTGTATGCTLGAPSGSGSSWTVLMTGCSDGTVILRLNPNSVTDAAGNTGPAAAVTADTVTRDATPPTAAVIAPATPTNAATLTYGLVFSEQVTGLVASGFTLGGTAAGCVVGAPSGSGTAWTVTLSGCSGGTVTFGLKPSSVTDQAGNTGPTTQADAAVVTVFHDSTPPTFTSPIAVTLRPGVSLSTASTTSTIPVLITWAAADEVGGSGLNHYVLETSPDNINWAAVAPVLTPQTTSLATTMRTSGVVYYRVTAYDGMGNWIRSATPGLTPRITQQSSTLVKYSGTWYLYKSASASGATLKWSTAKNASVTYTFTGRGIGVVTAKGPNRGSVKVYIDGRYKLTVSLYKTGTNLGRILAWQSGALASGTHTIKLLLVGTSGHPRVDIDAFVVMK